MKKKPTTILLGSWVCFQLIFLGSNLTLIGDILLSVKSFFCNEVLRVLFSFFCRSNLFVNVFFVVVWYQTYLFWFTFHQHVCPSRRHVPSRCYSIRITEPNPNLMLYHRFDYILWAIFDNKINYLHLYYFSILESKLHTTLYRSCWASTSGLPVMRPR